MLKFLCFQFLIQLSLSNDVLQCGSQSFQSHKEFFIIKNGSCLIPQSLTSKLNDSVSQKLYEGQKGRIALFSIYSGSQTDPYSFYISGERKIQLGFIGERGTGSGLNNFRSPILDEWKSLRPSFMDVSVEDYFDEVVARLLFKVSEMDTIESWFNKGNLIESFPWNINILRNYNYNFFNLTGYPNRGRKFYINVIFDTCNNDHGMLGIFTSGEQCQYGQTWPNKTRYVYPQILFINDNGKAGNWILASAAKSLKLTGIYDPSITIYI